MKPPPRTRTKPARDVKVESEPRSPGKVAWQRTEQRKLLTGLKAFRRTADVTSEIDYGFLRKYVPNRSTSEVHSVVESLKNKVISGASFELRKKRWEETKARKPIELWTHMASAVAGSLEEPISTAFTQMLIVSSTEPRTLRNCEPPKGCVSLTDRPLGSTLSLRTVPCLPVQGERPGINTAQPAKTPAATAGPVVCEPNSKIPPSQHQLCTAAGTSAAAASTPPSAAPSCQARAGKELDVPSASPLPASQTGTPVRGQVQPGSITAAGGNTPISTSSVPPSRPDTPLASSATTKDSRRSTIVDFEKIYKYLSVIHKPDEACHLTPMESAIVLDLLMSLPEELPLLDCNKLHKHLVEEYQCLSSFADSKTAREMFKNLKDGQTEAPSSQGGGTAVGRHDAAGAADGCDVTEVSQAESQSSGNNKTSGDTGVTTACPPLNPFMIPLKLLMRK